MKRIALFRYDPVHRRRRFALVDDEDYDALSQFRWCSVKGWYTRFAVRTEWVDGVRKAIRMHNQMSPQPGLEVCHINYNGLDNRRENLRLATRAQNSCRTMRDKTRCSSRFPGVSWSTRKRRWQASIRVDGISRHLGLFDKEEDAARARDKASIEFFGSLTALNFPIPQPGSGQI